MSVNFSSINGSTIDSFTGLSRTVIVAQLIERLRTTKRGSHGSASQPRYSSSEEDRAPIRSTELDRIIVTAMFQELSGSDEQLVTTALDLVYISDIMIEPTKIIVNIADLEITC